MAKLYELTDDYLSLWESLSDPEADWTEAEKKLRGIERALAQIGVILKNLRDYHI